MTTSQVRIRQFPIHMHLIPRQHPEHALLYVVDWLGYLPSHLNVPVSTCALLQVTSVAAFVEQAASVDAMREEIETDARSCEAVDFYRAGAARPTAVEVSSASARCSCAHASCTARSVPLTRSLTHTRRPVRR